MCKIKKKVGFRYVKWKNLCTSWCNCSYLICPVLHCSVWNFPVSKRLSGGGEFCLPHPILPCIAVNVYIHMLYLNYLYIITYNLIFSMHILILIYLILYNLTQFSKKKKNLVSLSLLVLLLVSCLFILYLYLITLIIIINKAVNEPSRS